MTGENPKELAALVEQTIKTLFDKGIAAVDLAPLIKLHEAVKQMDAPQASGNDQTPENDDVMEQAPAPGGNWPATPPSAQPTMPQQAAPAAGPAQQSTVQSWSTNGDTSGIYDRDGRRGEVKASEDLMARASAIVDLLVHGGDTTEHACQVITRQLLSVGIQLPECGGDARAWKRLMNWRNTLIHYKRNGPAWDAYCAFKEQLAHIPPEMRMRTAVGERLWDQRQLDYSNQNIA